MNPFELHTPSVFVVCSPFQALCAIATIRQLKIEDYKLIACFIKGDSRNEQLKKIFADWCVDYVPRQLWRFPFNVVPSMIFILHAIKHRHGKYNRLFLGDFRDHKLFYIGCRYVSDAASVVYLDDGNVTISLLQGLIPDPAFGKDEMVIKTTSKFRKMDLFKHYLTIYNDIPNLKYNISRLDLSGIILNNQGGDMARHGVYIVGTNIDPYCSVLNYSHEMFMKKLEKLIVGICDEYPSEAIVYIPHGRDESNYARNLCLKYDCVFHKADVMVELELLNQPNTPMAIYGYTSSALYNLKKIFPHTRVINVLMDGDENNIFYRRYLMTSDYYMKNGIELIKL